MEIKKLSFSIFSPQLLPFCDTLMCAICFFTFDLNRKFAYIVSVFVFVRVRVSFFSAQICVLSKLYFCCVVSSGVVLSRCSVNNILVECMMHSPLFPRSVSSFRIIGQTLDLMHDECDFYSTNNEQQTTNEKQKMSKKITWFARISLVYISAILFAWFASFHALSICLAPVALTHPQISSSHPYFFSFFSNFVCFNNILFCNDSSAFVF